MKPPSLDVIEALFVRHYPPDSDDPERLRNALAVVREAMLLGVSRATVRQRIRVRQQSRRPPGWRENLVESHAVVLQRAADAEGVEVEQLLQPDGSRAATRARYAAMFGLRLRGLSYQEIGSVVGGRSHVAAIKGVRRVEQWIESEPRLAAKLRRLAA